jgi:ABC-type multidrug transport system permease subunit
MEQEITRRAARSHLIWWAAYVLLVVSLVASTWALSVI